MVCVHFAKALLLYSHHKGLKWLLFGDDQPECGDKFIFMDSHYYIIHQAYLL